MAGSEYYNHSTYPSTGSSGSSSAMRAELETIESGFGKLPALAGNGGKIVAVNSGETAQEAISVTGTGSVVKSISPSLVTPLLGTPTSGTLTNCTGLPVTSGVSGLGAEVATFLATPSSANLASALTDETGGGAAVFATSPTLVTPLLGTPASGDLRNCSLAVAPAIGSTTPAAIFGTSIRAASGTSIASAATVNLANANGNTVSITGTTPTSALTMDFGQHMTLIAAGAWPLIHNTTTLNTGWGADYTCRTGDVLDVFRHSSGVVYVYLRAKSGVWTPTLTNSANIDSSTASECFFSQSGNYVDCDGSVTIDPTASGATTTLLMSKPISQTFSTALQCAGTFANAGSSAVGGVSADTGTNLMAFGFVPTTASSVTVRFSLRYKLM